MRGKVLYVDVAPIFSESISGFNYSVPNLAAGRVVAGAQSLIVSSYTDRTRPWLTVVNVFAFLFTFVQVLLFERRRCKVIFVFHGTWIPLHWVAGLILGICNISYYHTPRGDLTREALKRSYGQKKIAYNLVVKRFFRASRGVNFLSPGEKDSSVWKSDFACSFVCPNGVASEIFNQFSSSIEWHLKSEQVVQTDLERSPIRIGFLGRFDVEIKGVDRFIEWCSEYNRTHNGALKALLAGPPSDELEGYLGLRRLNGFEDEGLCFLGPCVGDAKYDFLRSLDVLVIPSRSEGVPAVFFEALSCVPRILVSTDIRDNLKEFISGDDLVSFVGGYGEFEGRLDDALTSNELSSQNLASRFEQRRDWLLSFEWASIGLRYRELVERGAGSF